MTTLTAISFNLAGSIGVFCSTMVAFGCAVKSQNTFVAARCTARPPTVIYNPSQDRHPSQDRGNPTLGWITWVMRLTYDTMLGGVPGTGTRDGGLSGALLKVNLDGIVLLRFHHLCLRVTSLAAFLYLVVVLPVYATSRCSRIGGDYDSEACQGSMYNLTDYQRLTLANIPTIVPPKEPKSFVDVLLNWFLPVHDGNLARLYVVVFVTWIVTSYALRELKLEWGDVLAMRRVYYLEADHWKDRNEELEQTLLRVEREKIERRNSAQHTSARPAFEKDETYLTDRKPWIPHPEQRDTVPNIELYSLLVGGLPSLPTEVVDQDEVEAFFSRKQSIDWQLSVTTAFFDHCVPNQPGFSSSIAAVTILPSAPHLTEAWNQWYRVAGKLRRLRFIRKEIAKRKKMTGASSQKKLDIEQGGGGLGNQLEQSLPQAAQPEPTKSKTQGVYSQSQEKKEYYQEVLGSTDDLQVESKLLCALDFGPEQTAAYSREFALGAANLAPYGWHEHRILNASLEELLKMEKAAVEQVHKANAALRQAQERIAEDSKDDSDGNLSDEELHVIMQNATSTGARNSSFGPSRDAQTVSTSFDEEERSPKSSGTPPVPPVNDSDRGTSSPSRGATERPSTDGRDVSASFGSFSTDDDSFFGDDSSGSICQIQLTGKEDKAPSPRNDSHRRRAKRSNSIDSTRSNLSRESGDLKRRGALDGMGALGKSVMKMTRLTRSSSSESLEKLAKKKRVSKADINSARLPSDLGLEAGLWMEQKAMTVRSNHGRTIAPRRGKSSLGASMHGIHHHHVERIRSTPKRNKSSDDIDLLGLKESNHGNDVVAFDTPKPAPMKRNLSSDDVDLLSDDWSAKNSETTQNEKLTHEAETSSTDSTVQHTNTADGIWARLEKDKERKQKLRARLSSMQEIKETKDTTQSNLEDRLSPNVASVSAGQQATNGEEILGRPKRVREYRQDHGIGRRRGPQNESSDQANNEDRIDHKVPPISNLSGRGRPLQSKSSVSNQPATMALAVVDESEINDDFSVDMNALAATAQAYGGPNHFENSVRSLSSHQVEDNLRIAFDFEEKAGLRRRDVGGEDSSDHDIIDVEDKWTRVTAIVQESSRDKKVSYDTEERMISSGQWYMSIPTFHGIYKGVRKQILLAYERYKLRMKPPEILDDLVRDSSYAVVTFTSRQAAVAARHCLADSRGHDRWVTVGEIPSPPLADAPSCNMSGFRGCVRPVTLSISEKQKILRHTLAISALAAIYFFYTIPLTAAQQLVSPQSLSKIFPDILQLQQDNLFLANIFTGFIPALVWTAFFAVCPPMFKIIANFGSNATSSVTAENSALSYFWWFMLLSAFTGTSFSTAIINGLNGGLNLGSELQRVIESTAATIPTQVSATWLNWMIVRVFAVLPTQYLLQLNTFIFSCLGLKCCARTVRGGGAGGPVPYRIYVDSGVVMLCVFALAPASPLIAPAAYTYFLFCTPMLRWTMIFLYRPKFDVGGGRFPFIFDICISGMVTGQILLVAMMTLKRAIGPAVAAFCPMIPTIWFRYFVRRRYLRAFSDAALLQTSLLDGWDTNIETSQEKREEFRKFLVDCHKAAYVPVCIAGDQSTMITAEPAVVVPVNFDDDDQTSLCEDLDYDADPSERGDAPTFNSDQVTARLQQQPGAMTRRASTFQAPPTQMGAMMRRTSLVVQQRGMGLLDGSNHANATYAGFRVHSPKQSPRRMLASPKKTVGHNFAPSSGPFFSPAVSTTAKPRLDLSKIPKSPLL